MLFTVILSGIDGSRNIAWPFTGRHRLRLTSWYSLGESALGIPYIIITSRTVVNPMQPEFLYALNTSTETVGSSGWARSGYFETELSGVYDFQIRTPQGAIIENQDVIVVLTFEIEKV